MSPKQLALQLMKAKEAFVPITWKTSHNDSVCIRESLTPLLLQVGYNKSHAKHNLWGVIAPEYAYVSNYSGTFAPPKRIGAYPPISQDAIDHTRKLEDVWKIRIGYYALYDTGIRGAATFILVVIDNM